MPVNYSPDNPFFDPRKRIIAKLFNSNIALALGKLLKPIFDLEKYFTKKRIKNWEIGGVGKLSDPTNFLKSDLTDQKIFLLINKLLDKQSKILDLGCNCGRTLNVLFENGFHNLNGVDIMKSSFELGRSKFLNMYQSSTTEFYCNSFQDFLLETPSNQYDLVYSRGATVELVNPYFPLVKNLSRISKKYILLCVFENLHYYPRLWEWEFLKEGYYLMHLERLIDNNLYTYLLFEKNPKIKNI